MKRSLIMLGIMIIFIADSKAQQVSSTNYLSGIKNHDLGKLWHAGGGKTNAGMEAVTVPEPIGLIGENCQRFYIHYNSIVKSKTIPNKYNVKGKTKVKDNICSFSGSITIVKAGIFTKQFDYRYKQGFVECEINFKEDSTQNNTGAFKGKLVSKFYLDEKRAIQYDDLLFGADLYFNNQCQASWTSYTTQKTKKVNWGDYRIPGNTGFDIGDGEFMIADKYLNNGWQNYKLAMNGDPESAATQKAIAIENDAWWK